MKVQYRNLSKVDREATYAGLYMRYLLKKHGLEITEDAKIILCTVSDPDAYKALRRTRKKNKNAIIIVGGAESYMGEWMTTYADYVVAGKGERFIEMLAKHQEIPVDLPEVYTADSVFKKYCYPYEDNNIQEYPVIKTGKNSAYAVMGFGCQGKCTFCVTGWVQPHRTISDEKVMSVIRSTKKNIGNNARITFVTNDYSQFRFGEHINAQSVRVADMIKYNKNGVSWKDMLPKSKFSLMHIGVEGISEEMRKRFGKPVRNRDIRYILEILKKYDRQCQLFFISGVPGDGDISEIEDMFPSTRKLSPNIYLKFTGFQPSPHTPMWGIPYTAVHPFTHQYVKNWRQSFAPFHNRRVRLFFTRSPVKEIWRGIIKSSYPGEAEIIGPPPDANLGIEEYYEELEKKGVGHTIEIHKNQKERGFANSHIVTPYRKSVIRGSTKWGYPIHLREFKDQR